MDASCFEQWATLRIEKGAPKESVLKSPASMGKSSLPYGCPCTESFRASLQIQSWHTQTAMSSRPLVTHSFVHNIAVAWVQIGLLSGGPGSVC